MIQELQYYLTQVDCGVFASGTLGANVKGFTDIEDLSHVDVFLLSIPDARGDGFSMQVRKELYSLFPHFNVSICDLGCLKIGNSLSDTLHSYRFVSEQIRRIGKLLLVLDTHCFVDLLALNQENNLSAKTVIFNNSFRYPTFSGESTHLLSLAGSSTSFIGLQNFLSSQEDYSQAADANITLYRLGEVIEHTKSIEPVLRDTSSGFASLAVLERSTDFKVSGGSVNGISIHNLCQLFYYAGRSRSMNLFVIDGSSFCRATSEGYLASLIAQNAWQFLLGRAQVLAFDKSANSYKSYYISHFHDDVDFCFYEDLALKIWWLEISIGTSTSVIAATYDDYKKMQDGEIPKVVAHALSKK